MKMSDYAALHANDGKKLDVETIVSATTLVNEIIEITDFSRIDKTKFGTPSYIVKMQDGTGFYTTSSMTRQLDKWIDEGVEPESIKGSRFVVVSTTLPAKDGKPEVTFLSLEFVE